MDFLLRSTKKTMEEHGIKWGGKTFMDLGHADDLSILDMSVSKMNELLEVLQVQSARIGLKFNVQKTKLLRLGIREDENVTLGNEKIDQVDGFTYLGSITSKDSTAVNMLKIEYPTLRANYHSWKVWKNRKISLQTYCRILEAIVMTVFKYSS